MVAGRKKHKHNPTAVEADILRRAEAERWLFAELIRELRANVSGYEPTTLPNPTDETPGTAEKQDVLAERAARGLQLFHPERDPKRDARFDTALTATANPNGPVTELVEVSIRGQADPAEPEDPDDPPPREELERIIAKTDADVRRSLESTRARLGLTSLPLTPPTLLQELRNGSASSRAENPPASPGATAH